MKEFSFLNIFGDLRFNLSLSCTEIILQMVGHLGVVEMFNCPNGKLSVYISNQFSGF